MNIANRDLRRTRLLAGATALIAVIVLQMILLANANSATWDEPDHLYSAYMQSKHGDFGLNPEHPPLVKYLGALPFLNRNLVAPPLEDRPYRLQEAVGGRDFLYRNDANTILVRARLATSIVTVLLAGIVFLASKEMFGAGAGLIALGLIAFDPTLLAHSALMTTDVGQACFMFWSLYAFYRYVKSPSMWRLLAVALIVGLALASKHSAILLFPMLLLLAIAEVFWLGRHSDEHGPRRLRRRIADSVVAIGAIAVVSIAVLWSFYGFRYAARGSGLHLNPSFVAQIARVPSRTEGDVLAIAAKFHLLPESYLYGFAHVLIQSKAFHSFLLGTIYPNPVWFYFPVAMLIKSSLTFLILLGITIWAVATGRLGSHRETVFMAVPAAIYMVFAMSGGMNIGVRHVLPVYIFLCVPIAGAMWKLIQNDRRWLYPVIALLVFQAVSVTRSYPAYISYANEAFGGPRHTHELLSDSSSDWGQQLKSVKHYLDVHRIHDCWFAYFGQGVVDYSYYGIPCRPLITADSLYFDTSRDVPVSIDGPVLMSASVLSGFEFGPGALNPYEQFKWLKPVAVIDDGVFVYDGHFNIPLAAALSDEQKADILLAQKKYSEALAEATLAEVEAPKSASVNAVMGQTLDAIGSSREAQRYYAKALILAQTVEPRFQVALKNEMQSHIGQ